jgi:MFS family permease
MPDDTMASADEAAGAGDAPGAGPSTGPARAGLVLAALILVAAVANLNLAVANVALPDIGKDFGASQTALNLVAVGYSLGLAASVLYLGALGDRSRCWSWRASWAGCRRAWPSPPRWR